MYFDIYYKNHLGNAISLVREPYRLQTAELFDYSWEPYTESGYITDFSKEIVKKSATLTISAGTEQEYIDAINKFYEVTELDILNMNPGRLYIGNQYMECYIISSSKTEWEYGIEQMDIDIIFATDYPNWVEETVYEFEMAEAISTDNKVYVGRYAYRYANGLTNKEVVIDHFYEMNFLMRIYGPIVNPLVTIGNNQYLVYIVLDSGEYIEIDSRNGTIIKRKSNGDVVNAFNNRSKEYDVFKRIDPGRKKINWSGKFKFDLVLYAERSEPKWGKFLTQN